MFFWSDLNQTTLIMTFYQIPVSMYFHCHDIVTVNTVYQRPASVYCHCYDTVTVITRDLYQCIVSHDFLPETSVNTRVMLRVMLYEEVLQLTNSEPIKLTILKRRWRYLGHVLRISYQQTIARGTNLEYKRQDLD